MNAKTLAKNGVSQTFAEGDSIKTKRDLLNDGDILIRTGTHGKIVKNLVDDKFAVEFPGLPFTYNYWSDELERAAA